MTKSQKREARAFRIVSWITIIIGLVFCLYLGFNLIYPFKISHTTFTVLTPKVKAGGQLALLADYCKWMDVSGMSTRQLVDGIVIDLPPATTNLPVGCNKIIRYIPIPTDVPPGKYRYHTTVKYEISKLRTVDVATTSPQFEVTR